MVIKMKTIVVYQSTTGFTEQYAKWIAEECNCETRNIKKISGNDLSQYDRVIYGGWIMGNLIIGLDKIMKMNPKELVVFAVGSSPASEEIKDIIKEQNHLESLPFFYFEGGFRFEKLSFPIRMMLKAIKKSVAKKKEKTEQDEFMVEALGTSFDHSDRKFIEPLVSFFTHSSTSFSE
ncbi:MAG: flavodoxin domain-containing protein [Lachnospiraceae bacterium]|nr:flavodoxin domain-containing protein [Lachnospiraceae bacterium]